MRPNERLSLLGSRLFVIGAGALVVVMVCAGLALAFTDVSSGDDYAEAIDELSRLQIITGFEDGSFRPDALVTRQQFAKMIVRTLAGVPQQIPLLDHMSVRVRGKVPAYRVLTSLGEGRNQAKTRFHLGTR